MTDNLFLLSFTLRAMNLSNEALGLLFGSAGLKYFPYMIANLVAIAPSAISYIILGKDLNLIESIQSPIFWGAIVIDCIMDAIMTTYFKKKKASFPSDKPEIKIDYIFVSHDIGVLSADIPEIIASDHRPHIAEVLVR